MLISQETVYDSLLQKTHSLGRGIRFRGGAFGELTTFPFLPGMESYGKRVK